MYRITMKEITLKVQMLKLLKIEITHKEKQQGKEK